MLAVVVLVNLVILALAAAVAYFLPRSEEQGGGWNLNYTTRDLIVLAVISAVGGVVYTGLSFPYQAAQAAGGPLGSAVVAGAFAFSYVVVFMLIRKPGCMLATGILGTVVQALLGNPAGVLTIGWGVFLGISFEIVVGAARYRNASLPLMMIAAAAASQVQTIWSWILYGWSAAVSQYFLSIPVIMISAAILSGGIGYLIGRMISRSGLVQTGSPGPRRT